MLTRAELYDLLDYAGYESAIGPIRMKGVP